MQQALKGQAAMEKWLCWGSMGVAGLLLVLFLLDVLLGIPFGGISLVVDICCMVAAALLLYMSFDALRDLQ